MAGLMKVGIFALLRSIRLFRCMLYARWSYICTKKDNLLYIDVSIKICSHMQLFLKNTFFTIFLMRWKYLWIANVSIIRDVLQKKELQNWLIVGNGACANGISINIDMEDDLYRGLQKVFVKLVQYSHYCNYFCIDFYSLFFCKKINL